MEQAASIVVSVLLVVLGLAVGGTVVGALAAALTGTRVRWLGRIGLGVAGLFVAALALVITGLVVSEGPAHLGLAAAGAVALVFAARGVRRAVVAAAKQGRRPAV